jgi:hypothetical protein
VYNVPVGFTLPVEGAPMPGETASLLGPFIEANGITFGQQRDGAKQQVILKCKLLKARS